MRQGVLFLRRPRFLREINFLENHLQEKITMFRKASLFIMVIALLFSACAPAVTSTPVLTTAPKLEPTAAPKVESTATLAPMPEPIKLTDGLGRKVQLAQPAQRIVSIAP
jgi:ABC-type Fe3+-hydroxamate transport system substrate-binding protein